MIGQRLKVVNASFDFLWSLRERRDEIDVSVAQKQKIADKLVALANREGTKRAALLIARCNAVKHEINRLLDDRAEIVARIAVASQFAVGNAKATRQRLA